MRNSLLLLLCAVLLTSCSFMSPVKGPSQTYILNTLPHPPVKRPMRKITLAVAEPETSAMYNTAQMVYTVAPYQFGYFAKSGWAGTPAQMLQPLMIQTLQRTHYFFAVTPATGVGSYNYLLNSQIIQLEQKFIPGASLVLLTVRVQVISLASNQITAAKDFYIIVPTPCRDPCGGAIAANKAVAIFLRQLAAFCLHVMR